MNKKDLFYILSCFSYFFSLVSFLIFIILGVCKAPLDAVLDLMSCSNTTEYNIFLLVSVFLFFVFDALFSIFIHHYYSKKD